MTTDAKLSVHFNHVSDRNFFIEKLGLKTDAKEGALTAAAVVVSHKTKDGGGVNTQTLYCENPMRMQMVIHFYKKCVGRTSDGFVIFPQATREGCAKFKRMLLSKDTWGYPREANGWIRVTKKGDGVFRRQSGGDKWALILSGNPDNISKARWVYVSQLLHATSVVENRKQKGSGKDKKKKKKKRKRTPNPKKTVRFTEASSRSRSGTTTSAKRTRVGILKKGTDSDNETDETEDEDESFMQKSLQDSVRTYCANVFSGQFAKVFGTEIGPKGEDETLKTYFRRSLQGGMKRISDRHSGQLSDAFSETTSFDPSKYAKKDGESFKDHMERSLGVVSHHIVEKFLSSCGKWYSKKS